MTKRCGAASGKKDLSAACGSRFVRCVGKERRLLCLSIRQKVRLRIGLVMPDCFVSNRLEMGDRGDSGTEH